MKMSLNTDKIIPVLVCYETI